MNYSKCRATETQVIKIGEKLEKEEITASGCNHETLQREECIAQGA
jgi:hypothetical protein